MTTLLTHEWLRTRSLLTAIAAIAAIVVVVGTLTAATGLALVSVFGAVLALAAALALVPVVQMALAVDYWRSSYGRVGYFTQTLPVPGPRIYWAKMAWAWVASLGAVVLALLLLALAWPGITRGLGYPERNPLTVLADTWSALTAAVGTPTTLALLALTLVMVLVWPAQYYFSASFGSEAPLNRLGPGGPVLVWVVLYLLAQLLALVGLFAIPFAIGAVDGGAGIVPFDAWGEMTAGSESADVFPVGVLPPILLVTALAIWRTVRSWGHKVSLL